MDTLNYISVAESAHREVSATGARLALRISGQSFFTGREAFKKAAEVSQCVTGLKSCGIAEEKIRIKNVSTHVESGLLSKTSSATYDLEITCDSMDLLGPAVATVASLKNSEIVSMAWDYSEITKIKREILQEAVRLANASATAIASALNISLNGVHRLKYEISGLDDRLPMPRNTLSKMKRAKVAEADFASVSDGLNLTHTTKVVVDVTADFHVKT